jgi:hypothetical protein
MPGLVRSTVLGPRLLGLLPPEAWKVLSFLKVEAMVMVRLLELRPVKKLCVEKQQVEESVKGPK